MERSSEHGPDGVASVVASKTVRRGTGDLEAPVGKADKGTGGEGEGEVRCWVKIESENHSHDHSHVRGPISAISSRLSH